MKWKAPVGWLLVAFGVVGLLVFALHIQGSSYGVGNVVGGILIVLLGVWLIRSSHSGVRS